MEQSSNFFAYKIRQSIYKVQTKDIMCLESHRRKMILHMADGRVQEFYGKIKDICQSNLMDYGFISIHKSYVVNFCYINKLKYLELTLANGTILPVSQKRYKDVKSRYLGLIDKAN